VTEQGDTVKAEGWFQDPFEIHEDRWYSDGVPTALVRDGDVEAQNPPPSSQPASGKLVRSVPRGGPGGPEDLRRADTEDSVDYGEKAFDVIGEFIPPAR
jgi:hypothetical protein